MIIHPIKKRPLLRQKFLPLFTLFVITMLASITILASCTEGDQSSSKSTNHLPNRANSTNMGDNDMKENSYQNGYIVLTGASYAKGWPLKNIKGLSVINRGVDGAQSFEVLSRFRKDVITVKPRAVIIWGYINDIFRTNRNKIDIAIKKAKDSFVAMVELSKKNGIIPILATEVTLGNKKGVMDALKYWVGKLLGKTSYQDYINKHVLDLNRWLKSYAQKNNLLVLDLQPIISDANNLRLKEYATEDGSHISKQGYEKLTIYATKRIGDYLKR